MRPADFVLGIKGKFLFMRIIPQHGKSQIFYLFLSYNTLEMNCNFGANDSNLM